jgi:mRNA-degrading endonuclease RelE of RelBE toxin-antitoxin system
MRIEQKPRFQKKYKKLHSNQLPEMNAAISAIIADPHIGEQKKGDLGWLRVYKFKIVGQLFLLGYQITEPDDAALVFIDFGVHENFYRDLKK